MIYLLKIGKKVFSIFVIALLGAFHKIGKAAVSLVMSLRPSIHIEHPQDILSNFS
jgi:hypothetical protein